MAVTCSQGKRQTVDDADGQSLSCRFGGDDRESTPRESLMADIWRVGNPIAMASGRSVIAFAWRESTVD